MKPLIDVDAVPATGFGLAELLSDVDGDWHSHRRHQLLYAAEGVLHLVVEDAQWLLPPQRAAWIGAEVRHRVRTRGASLRTTYLASELVDAAPGSCCVFPVTSLAREMLLYAVRWGPERDPDDDGANRYFSALASLAVDWTAEATPLRLPTARTPELARAMTYALEHLEDASLERAARAAGLSTRTLSRRFAEEGQTSWRQFLHDARLLRAMELLAVKGAQVTDVAFSVGFDSLGAFTRAFTELTGECPRDYRRRVNG